MKLRIFTFIIVFLLFSIVQNVQAEEIIDNYEDGSVYGEYPWTTPSGLPSLNVAYAYNGDYGARYAATAGTPAQSSAYWNYRDIDMTGHDTLSFWANERAIGADAGGWGGYCTVTVEDGGSWVFNYLDTPSQVWEYHEIDVSGLTGVKTVQVNWKAVWGNTEVWIDDILLDYSSTVTLSGTVTSSASGTIEGVLVSLNNSGGSDTTNETGYYEITGIEPDSYLLTATSATHSDYTDIISITTDTTENFQMTRLLPEITTYNAEEEPTSIQLNFIGNGVTDSVKVYRDGTLLGTRATIISGNWIDTGLTVGETHEYCLTPYDGLIAGTQICFDATTVTTLAGSPFIPIGDETPVPTPTPDDNSDNGIFDSIEDIIDIIIDPILDIIDPIIEFMSESTSQLMQPLEDLMEPIIEPVQSIYEEITHTTETSSFLFILFAYFGALVASLLLFYSIESKIDISTILLSGTIGWILPLLITFIGIINLIFISGILTGLVFAVFGFVIYVVMNSISSEENMPGRIK